MNVLEVIQQDVGISDWESISKSHQHLLL